MGGTTNLTPDTPYSFATYSDLSAAVAANGGQSLGPAVSVAGVLWDWSATRGRYIPGNAVSFATYAALPTFANTSQDIGIKTWLVNPLTPDMMTRVYWTGTLWAPVPGQLLYGAYGAVLSLADSSALVIGSWNEIWASPVLPDWFFPDRRAISLTVSYEIRDPVSTALEKARVALRDAASASGDENYAILGHSGNANPGGRGLGGVRVRAHRLGAQFYGQLGGGAYLPFANPSLPRGGFSGGTTRLRLDAWPGATTNVHTLNVVELWSGG